MFFPAQFDQTEPGRRVVLRNQARRPIAWCAQATKGTQTKGTDMTGNTTARTQAIELAERLREVAAWNVRLHLAKEELEQQTLCEATGVTQGHHIGQNEPRRRMGPQRHRGRGRHPRHASGRTARRHAVRHRQQRRHEHKRWQRCIVGGSADLDAPGTPHRRQVRPVENKKLLPNHNDGDRSKPVPPERVYSFHFAYSDLQFLLTTARPVPTGEQRRIFLPLSCSLYWEYQAFSELY